MRVPAGGKWHVCLVYGVGLVAFYGLQTFLNYVFKLGQVVDLQAAFPQMAAANLPASALMPIMALNTVIIGPFLGLIIVFGDEPTGALNSKAACEIMGMLADINQSGTTILLVTHDVKVAAKTERVLFVLDGTLVAEQRLGKYCKENNEIKEREENLSRWLLQMGL